VYRYEIINYLIEQRGYKTYLEIGIDNPNVCFSKIRVKNKEGVDPAAKCKHQMTSDAFFEKYTDSSWDIIFIDGLHENEQAARDIKNSLLRLNKGGTIVVHDCNPPTKWYTRPYKDYKRGSAWNGTTYQAFVRFAQSGLDLDLMTVETDYGCGIIQNPKDVTDFSIPDYELSWEDFHANRKELLNLVSVKDFRDKYKRS